MEKMRQWSILTAVGVLAIFVAGWFLMVSPQRSHAADLRTQAQSQQSANDTLRTQVQQLEAQKKGLPAQQRLLDQIATKIPGDPQLPTLIRQLSTAAEAAGVDLVTLAPSDPTLVAPPLATTSVAATGTSSATAAGPASPAAAPLAQIPVAITVEGTYFNLNSFFSAVEKLKRAVLVTGWTISPKLQGGGPADQQASPDALSATLNSIVFESPAAITPATTSTAAK